MQDVFTLTAYLLAKSYLATAREQKAKGRPTVVAHYVRQARWAWRNR